MYSVSDIAGPYSSLKILHHPERIAQLRRGEQIVPTQLQIILSDLCNHSCSFCSYRWDGYSSSELFTLDVPLAKFGHNNPIRMMSTEKAMEIIDDCVAMGVEAVQYTGGGEITVHPDHVQIMKYSLDKGLDCALVSNGELFREGHIENLLRFKWVRFSLDAGTQETYGSIRGIPASRMNRVLDNIAALVAARHKQIESGDECDLIIGIGFVVTKENHKEVVQCAELAKTLGVDNMRISAVFQPDDDEYFSEIHEEAFRLCRQAESLSDSKFVVFNNYSERVQDLADKHPDYSFCGYQQLVSYVGADLNVYRCCVTSYSKKGAIGSLKNQRFRDLWESDAKKRDFESFDARGCPRCMFNRKNKTILYALDTKPRHANFV